jgi:purine-binding chemotaxis protein CheW
MRAIAEAPAAPGAGRATEPSQYLAFVLGQETLALPILVIREIIEYCPLTQVPTMPPWICGVIDLRGAAVPVVDLSVRFGRLPTPVTRRTCIVLVECLLGGKRQGVGFLVDAVKSVLEIARQDIEAVPEFGINISPAFMSGVAKANGTFIKLLNVEPIVALAGPALGQGS